MYNARLAKLLACSGREGIDALLVSQLTNALYLSGFRGSNGALLITPQRRYIITDFRYHERVKEEVDPSYELVDLSGLDLATEVLPQLCTAGSIRRLGFEAEHVSYDLYTRLSALPGVTLVPTRNLVEDIRAVKEDGEVEAIRAAQRLGERIFTELLPLIGAQTSEADLAAEIEYRARKYGASACSFSPIIASGVRSAQPHAGFSGQQMVPGAPLTIDLGVILNDYCSDMTRTVFFRDCPPKWEQVFNIVRQAKDLAFAAIKPGVAASDVDAVARDFITQAGYGAHFRHGLGHGVGLPFKSAPVLHWASKDILQTGHVASDEPGIYLPGEGGVRIEDLFVVREHGAENLNELGTELTIVG